jgi:hypothetical protein
LTLPASGGTYTNTSAHYQQVVINGGTFSDISITRNGNTWVSGVSSPSVHMMAPGDIMTVTYSAPATLFWAIPITGA